MIIKQASALNGILTVPGDKSISHRSVMFGSLAKGTTLVRNFLQGADCLSSIDCFRQMGVDIENQGHSVLIHGNGLHGLRRPDSVLYTGNSGTTTRLMSGILAAQAFDSIVDGDASIRKRPMSRIITPLTLMGAHIESASLNGCAPLHIHGKALNGIHYQSPVASAQVKSAIMLAGLYADGITSIEEPYVSRNHTELMLKAFGAETKSEGTTAFIKPAGELFGTEIDVPGDISSAAYFIVAGLITPNSEILIRNVGINPTRDGIIKVCKAMGGSVQLENIRETGGETVADIVVKSSRLNGITIEGEIIPTLIDELPVIAVLACFAEGTTIIKDAQELKVKESNRIDVVASNLQAWGADVQPTEDGMVIYGGRLLKGAVIDSKLDHRIAMSFAIAGLQSEGEITIQGGECVNISYPDFYKDLEKLAR